MKCMKIYVNDECYFFSRKNKKQKKEKRNGKGYENKEKKGIHYYSYNVSPNIQGQQNQCTLLCRSI